MLQERKLNIDASLYERNIDANMSKPSEKKEINRHDSNLYRPTTIKDIIQWFTFLTIMEHTASIIKPNKGIITSLLRVFAIFVLRLIDDKYKLDAIDIKYICQFPENARSTRRAGHY